MDLPRNSAPQELPGLLGELGKSDDELAAVAADLLAADPDGSRFAGALRRTFDMLLDGQHTGRYRWDQLAKTEKTHAGTLVEINLQRAFGFADGDRLDYCISGTDVDCKYSQRRGGWMIPREAVGGLCLLVWASDQDGRWCAALVRANAELLNDGENRDREKTLRRGWQEHVRWLFEDAPLPENLLLRLPQVDIDAVFTVRSGQGKVNELFRKAQRRRISHNVIKTLAKQQDPMRCMRGNGGARERLRAEGIIILGQYESHREIAAGLGIPAQGPGEFVSARVARLRSHHGGAAAVRLAGERWTLAVSADPVEEAPGLPSTRAASDETE